MKLKNYISGEKIKWTGRVDDPFDPDAFRIHQVIKSLDLNKINTFTPAKNRLNIALIGFRCDEGIKRNLGRPGASMGPEYIRKEFANMPVRFKDKAIIFDTGDILCKDGNLEEAQEELKRAVKIVLNKKMVPIVLGGGHELAYGHFRGIAEHLLQQGDFSLGIINFDAHFDLRPFKGKGNSGTMFSQIADYCSKKGLKFSYMCLGIQTYANTISLFKRAKKLGVKYILGKEFIEVNFDNISEQIKTFIENHKYIYLTICTDVFNAAFAPGVSATQPFGMDPETVLKYIKEVLHTRKVIAIDIAEVSPRFDQDNRTAKLVAVILYAIINELSELTEKT